MVKCCHRPGKSMKRRSTARTSFSRIRARISRGVTKAEPPGRTATTRESKRAWSAPARSRRYSEAAALPSGSSSKQGFFDISGTLGGIAASKSRRPKNVLDSALPLNRAKGVATNPYTLFATELAAPEPLPWEEASNEPPALPAARGRGLRPGRSRHGVPAEPRGPGPEAQEGKQEPHHPLDGRRPQPHGPLGPQARRPRPAASSSRSRPRPPASRSAKSCRPSPSSSSTCRSSARWSPTKAATSAAPC